MRVVGPPLLLAAEIAIGPGRPSVHHPPPLSVFTWCGAPGRRGYISPHRWSEMPWLSAERTYVSPVLKYLVFFFNLLFWVFGSVLVGVAVWSLVYKNKFQHIEMMSVYEALFDFSLVFLVCGIIVFCLAFAGCVGALRENVCLLKSFYFSLCAIFLLLFCGAVSAFLLKDHFKKRLISVIQKGLIIRYTEDSDAKSVVDWMQEKLQCCGVGIYGFRDWNANMYYNCSKQSKSALKCFVPHSCCRKPNDIMESMKNILCGANVLNLTVTEANRLIYTRGCIQAGIAALDGHLPLLGGIFSAVIIPIILAIVLARCLEIQVQRQRGQWRHQVRTGK